jgi:hypothetical protein
MKSKYYTPKIEELHVGMYCEWLQDPANEIYIPVELTANMLSLTLNTTGWNFEKLNVPGPINYRVKYLDAKDIESLSFVKRGKTWAGYTDYEYTELIDGEVPYYLKATIHVPLMDDIYKIILHRTLNENTNIDKQLEQGESELMFRGRLKNKSELQRIMKQVGIL